MQHIESSQRIYFSTDYAAFKMMNGNRELSEKKIKKIIDEISSGNDMLKYYPIQVKEHDGRLDILDGQHRFYICRKLKRPVFYIVVTEIKSMLDIAKINSNVEKWKANDFINCYIQFGNTHYEQLRAFMEQYGFSLGVALKVLCDGHPGKDHGDGTSQEQFRRGEFKVNFMAEAKSLADNCQLFYQFNCWRSRGFVIAIHKIMEAGLYSINDLVADFKKYPDQLKQQVNYKSYIVALEAIANIRKQKRVIIA